MNKNEARALLAEAAALIDFMKNEMADEQPDAQVVATLGLAARTALVRVCDRYGSAIDSDT